MLLFNLLLALAWIALTGQFTPINFAAGLLLGYIFLSLLQKPGESHPYFRRVWLFVRLILFFLIDLVRANLRVAIAVLSPKPNLAPAVVAVPLEENSDLSITVLSNLITLTPGSLMLDISTDCRVMYVHTMHAEDIEQVRKDIKKLEARVLEVTR